MNSAPPWQLLADLVLLLHAALVLFVTGGLALIVAGGLRGWAWVRGRRFRLAHLAAIVVVAAQAWLGASCPLTVLENWLRTRARVSAYAGSFIEHWVQRLLYYEAPAWVFTLAYTVFALLVAAAWRIFPPHAGRRGGTPNAGGER
ncbi:MAG: DUF2784 domain-containing protein [Betaproteobacteria bacterium]|nr:DUF2784 domain-containing protein [Betaproteobacteria bacterium]